MREPGLRACQPRAYKRTTLPGEQPVTSPDLIGRDFTAAVPGTRLVGDITYLKTGEGWLYLATVIDLATRMVTGWQLASHMRTSLVTGALDMAITHGHVASGRGVSLRQGQPRRIQPVVATPRSRRCAMGRGRKQIAGRAGGCPAAVGGGSGVAAADAFTGPA